MNLETAVELLYTDESLTADVNDKTAKPLLTWAESVLPVLLARGESGFDDAFATLKKLIKSVARLIDLRGELTMEERAERAEKIQAFAQDLGIEVNLANLEALATFDGPELVAQMVGGTLAQLTAAAPPEVAQAEPAPSNDTRLAMPDPSPDGADGAGDDVRHALEDTVELTTPAASVPDGSTPSADGSLRTSIGDFFRRIAESLDADPDDPDIKE